MNLLPALTATVPTQPQLSNQKSRLQFTSPDLNNPANHRIPPKSTDSTVSWTSSISRHCRSGRVAEAASEFTRMRLAGIEPNHVTFVSLLSCCAHFPSQGKYLGILLHAYVCKLGLDRSNVMVGTSLADMYAKSGHVGLGRLVFDRMEMKNSMSWNTMIDGYMRNGVYACAVELFDEMPDRDAISWTALINGFVKRGFCEEALVWFREMLASGVDPDYVTIIAALAACADLGSLGTGLWIHCYVLKHDHKENVRIKNSLIELYSRCGSVEFAHQVFKSMTKCTLVSWNSIIGGFAANGYAKEALEHFDLMQQEGFKANGVSFTGALAACSHAGLVDKGLQYFNTMQTVYKISPRIEHYGCIVDLCSRAGKLHEAVDIVEKMPMQPNEIILGSLLAGCKNHGDIALAERVVNNLIALGPDSDSNYVLLANIYAAVGKWDGANKVRRRMKALGIQKNPGYSSIEVGCSVHEFIAGDKSHTDTEQIYKMLELLSCDLLLSGYVLESYVKESYEDD